MQPARNKEQQMMQGKGFPLIGPIHRQDLILLPYNRYLHRIYCNPCTMEHYLFRTLEETDSLDLKSSAVDQTWRSLHLFQCLAGLLLELANIILYLCDCLLYKLFCRKAAHRFYVEYYPCAVPFYSEHIRVLLRARTAKLA